MSTFGSPGGKQSFSRPTPPERGSFPLDHDAECRPIMLQYLQCLRRHRGENDDECRKLSQGYLQCRMERNLMAPDSMRNLGFHEEKDQKDTTTRSDESSSGHDSAAIQKVARNEGGKGS